MTFTKSEKLYELLYRDFIDAASEYEKDEIESYKIFEEYTKNGERKKVRKNNMIALVAGVAFCVLFGSIFTIMSTLVFKSIGADTQEILDETLVICCGLAGITFGFVVRLLIWIYDRH